MAPVFAPLLLLLSITALPASAATLYTTFGSGDSLSASGDAVGYGHVFNQNYGAMWANPFTLSTDAQVSAYRVAVQGVSSSPVLVLSLWSGVTEPTTLVEGGVSSASLSNTLEFLTLNSLTSPVLTAGVRYWLVMEARDPVNDDIIWRRSPLSGLERRRAFTGFSWQQPFVGGDAFEVQGTFSQNPVPEPGTALLLAAGFWVIGALGRRLG